MYTNTVVSIPKFYILTLYKIHFMIRLIDSIIIIADKAEWELTLVTIGV